MNSTDSKLIAVTEPDLFQNNSYRFFLFLDSSVNENIISLLSQVDESITVYIGNPNNKLEWVLAAHNLCDTTLLDAGIDPLITGLLIDKQKTYYYNSMRDVSACNVNKITDPLDFINQWLLKKLEG